MLGIHKIRDLFKKAFIPITIMLIPHSKTRPLNFKVPFIGVLISILLSISGTYFTFSIAFKSFEYQAMKKKLNYYSQQFLELRTTMSAIRSAEKEFKSLLSQGSKEEMLDNIKTSDMGSIDMEHLRQEIEKTIETVAEIKNYLRLQKNLYLATPSGLPVEGTISSHYGNRQRPGSGNDEFHSGVDISTNLGNSVRATADGIVSFSGWNGASGNLVVLEHGFGFSTVYAHNKINTVKVGQKVKEGEIIGYVGSTGSSTGPHVHYEVWKDGRNVNPEKYLGGKS